MPAARAQVSLPTPGPLLKKVCRHFSHKVEATFDDHCGEVIFPFGRAQLKADADKGVLDILVEAATDAQLEQTRSVVGSHVQRLSVRHPVSVSWNPPADDF